MTAIFTFTCSCCGKIHEGSPSYAFNAPDQYACLSDEQKTTMARIDTDLCTITHDEGTDYFIRTVMEVPIHDVAEPFTWGVWVSLSEKSFNRYVETYDAPLEGDGFFGWLCNTLPWYPPTRSLPTNVEVQPNGMRPLLFLQHESAHDHPLIIDQRHGISVAMAQEINEYLLHKA